MTERKNQVAETVLQKTGPLALGNVPLIVRRSVFKFQG